MTALKEYARLESMGLWKSDAQAQRRDVLITFGDATLMIRDTAERPLTHWSLPAIRRLNPGTRPAIYTPAPDGGEQIEIDDDTMIDAIETIRKALARGRPRPGRLRNLTTLGIALVLILLSVFWLPGALVRQALAAVSETTRAEIGEELGLQIAGLTGPACRSADGDRALLALDKRLDPDGQITQIVVMPKGLVAPVFLPGGKVLLSGPMVEDPEEPAVTAGYVLAALSANSDPLAPILTRAGPWAVLRFLTSGRISPAALRAEATYIATTPQHPDPEQLLARFDQAQVSSKPYAYAVDPSGETTLPLIEADPVTAQEQPTILNDGAWLSLQAICDG